MIAVERFAGPVFGDFREETVLDGIPLGSAGWLVLLCYKKTNWCRIVLWVHASPRQAHNRNALRHIWKTWRKPQDMPIVQSR